MDTLKDPQPQKILLAMRNAIFSNSFGTLLKKRYGERILTVSECTLARDVVDAYNILLPNIIIIDTKLHGGNSFSVMKELLAIDSDIKIVGVSETFAHDISATLQAMGACGYLLRSEDPEGMNGLLDKVMDMVKTEGKYPFLISNEV